MILRMMPGGDTIDFDALTAKPEDVIEGLVFVGEGSEEEQTGTLPDRAEMHGAPGLDESHPDVPVHQSVDIKTQTDTNGDVQIALAPPLGRYPGNDTAYVGCYPAEIGIEPEKIVSGQIVGGVTGTYGSDATVTPADVRDGKVYYDAEGRQIGNAGDFSAAAATLNCGESYTVQKGFHQQGTVRANSLGSQTQPQGTDANASAAQILTGYGAWANGSYRSGTMKNISADAVIEHTSSDDTPVVVGDECYQTRNSDNVSRFEIRYNDTAGYISKPTFFAIGLDKLRSALGIVAGVIKNGTTIAGLSGTYGADATAEAGHILNGKTAYGKNGKITGSMALTAGKIKKGETLAGITGTWYGNKKCIAATAWCGFGTSAYTPDSQSFTMPANGTVYYGGVSCFYGGSGAGTLRIYKNGSVVDSRDKEGSFIVRGSMVNKSFNANEGDVITVEATASSGAATMCVIQAVIVY